jgi:dTDP-4-amino-4,6-dideoxygalactose transaminase
MADMRAIKDLAKEKALSVVEDSAQAIDASGEGKKAGTWGELGTFSFQSNKTITAGEGGLVMTDDQDLAEKVIALRAFGRYKGRAAERSSALSSERLSSNYRLSEFQSAVLLSQLERFPTQDVIRQRNASQLTKGLGQIPGIRHVRKETANMKHSYYYYLVRYEPGQFGGLNPEKLCQALNAEGIPFVPGDGEPIYRHPVFSIKNLEGDICPEVLGRLRQAVDLSHPECPVAEEACGCTLILRHQVLLAEPGDMEDIVEAMWKVYKNIDELR